MPLMASGRRFRDGTRGECVAGTLAAAVVVGDFGDSALPAFCWMIGEGESAHEWTGAPKSPQLSHCATNAPGAGSNLGLRNGTGVGGGCTSGGPQ